jgi:hypothetical protein
MNSPLAKTRIHFPNVARLALSMAICTLPWIGARTSAAAPADQSPIDSRADAWLKRMGDFLAEAKTFSVNAEVWQDLQLSSGQHVQAGRDLSFQVHRPNRLRVEVHSTRRDRELLFDGTSITLINRDQNFYGSIPAKGALDEAMDLAIERFGIAMPLEDFLRSDPNQDLRKNVTSGTDIGPVTVMGVPCEHLAFSQEHIDWQVWIQTGAKPVPRKFLITYKDEPDAPQFTAIFSNWDLTPALPDFVFKFEPPPGASRIDVKQIEVQNEAQQRKEGAQ